MANIRVCDRCGDQIEVDPDTEVTYGACKCTVAYNNGTRWSSSYDLCSECKEKLNNFLKNKE